MRTAGCYRKEKGKHQELIKLGSKHTLEEVRAGLIKVFQALDWDTRILEQEKIVLSRERWSALRKPLNPLTTNEKEKGIQPLTAASKQNQLRENLAKTDEELFPKREIKKGLPVDYSNLSSSVVPPLEYFLSKENQQNLRGVIDQRNKTGCAVLADLLACEAWLTSNGIIYSGNAYDLFIDYCQSCSSEDWYPREWDTIWRSNSNKSFFPAIRDEGMQNRLHRYRRDNDPEYQAKAKAAYRQKFYNDNSTEIYLDSDYDIDLDSNFEDINIADIPDISSEEYSQYTSQDNELVKETPYEKYVRLTSLERYNPTKIHEPHF